MKQKKNKKILTIMIICIIVILIELLIMLIIHISRERTINHIDSLNNLIKTNNGYIGVGISDFNNSNYLSKKIYEYTDDTTKQKQNVIATQSKLVKYDNNFNLIWEKTFENDYDSTFYDIIEVNDGYVVVGSYAKDAKQISLNTRDALIIKYDYNGNIIWKQTYSVLSDTEFYKVITDDDKLIVIGQSIYENMELGNHITGGGIIVKYDMNGELLEHNNYGGNKSGKFNDIIKVDDGYIVCGKDATNYGILVKFKKNFNREENDTNLISKKVVWQRTYSNTDYEGFTSIARNNDILYLGGAINIGTEKDKDGNPIFQYDAGIVSYNTNSKYLGSYSIKNSTHHRINTMVIDNNNLYVNILLNVDSKDENKISMIRKYNLTDVNKLNDNIIYSKTFDNQNNFIINKLTKINDDIMYIGTTNKECHFFTGCDYQNIIEKYQEN